MGWPKLLSIEMAAKYLGLSTELVAGLVKDGSITPVPVPRPNTERERRRGAVADRVRRLLIDRADLDELVAKWKASV